MRLRQLREAAGLTQANLAERANLTAKGIAALERGRRQRPYPHTLNALADALKLTGEKRAEFIGATSIRATLSTSPGTAPALIPTPLPVPPTTLIGRDSDVAALTALVREGGGLVTLTGPGGVGKTRLAMAVARAVAAATPDSVAWVTLASLSDAALVLPTIAGALGLHEAGGQPIAEMLHTQLRNRQFLLVLDNCEHLLDAAPDIAGLRIACPGLVILATSRAPLRLRGEREYPVAPLNLPAMTRLPTVAEIAENPAVQLFVNRARDVAPSFALVQADAAAIVAICRRLDGLPLALELGAARVRLLRPTELLARLDQALPLLTGGPRDLPERQRTMRDTIAWSYDLLSDEERRLFRSLAVFAGGWSLAAAEAVAGGEDALGPLLGLVEQSLVVAATGEMSEGESGESRYRMLVAMREFATEQLEASDESEEVRRRHAAHYLAFAEQAGPGLEGPEQATWLRRLEDEHNNVRVAMTWALAAGQYGYAARLGWALQIFWAMRGYHHEGRRWMESVLASDGLAVADEARALGATGLLARMQGDYAVASARLAQAREHFRELGDIPATLAVTSRLGHAIRLGGDNRRARDLAEEGLALARAVGDQARAVWMLDVLGQVAFAERDYGRAAAIYREALPLVEVTGDGRYLAATDTSIGLAALGLGDYVEAEKRGRLALALNHRLGVRRGVTNDLDILASTAAAQGQPLHATRLFAAAKAMRDADGLASWSSADQDLYGPYLHALQTQLGAATFATTWATGKGMPIEEVIAGALTGTDD